MSLSWTGRLAALLMLTMHAMHATMAHGASAASVDLESSIEWRDHGLLALAQQNTARLQLASSEDMRHDAWETVRVAAQLAASRSLRWEALQQQQQKQKQQQQGATRRLQVHLIKTHTRTGFFIPDKERRLGMVYNGDNSRLRAALARWRAGSNLTIAVVGGSIAAGAGAVETHNWAEWFEDWALARYGGIAPDENTLPGGISSCDARVRAAAGLMPQLEVVTDPSSMFKKVEPAQVDPQFRPRAPDARAGCVRVNNGAVPGTLSSYMSMCHNIHVPPDADVVIVEYALNDEHTNSQVLFENAVRRPFERLLRKLMTYPKKPAVILLNAYAWRFTTPYLGKFYTTAEREFYEFATYYRVPMLSIKAACWGLMHQGARGFNVSRTRGQISGMMEPEEIDVTLRGDLFYWDYVHPDGWTGHKAMADLVIQAFMDAEQDLEARPITDHELLDIAQSPLPPPMIQRNFESVTDKCFIGDHFIRTVVSNNGFEWKNDAPEGKKPKFGFISTTPGSQLQLRINTTAPNQPEGSRRRRPLMVVELAHLKSYNPVMGRAQVRCVSGCRCNTTLIEGLHTDKVSLLNLHEFKVTQAHECLLAVTVMQETGGKGHKVKVAGVMVSDEGSGEAEGFGNWAAVEYVHNALVNGTFSVHNTR